MAYKLPDRVRMSITGTPGTGDVSLNVATAGFQTLTSSGLTTGDTFPYVLEDGSNWELGVGTYNSSGPSFARTTVRASSGGGTSKITAGPSTIVYSAIMGEDVGGTASVATLTDALITSPANNDLLTYETSSGKWKNKPAAGGGGAPSARYWRIREVQFVPSHSAWGACLAAFRDGGGTVLSTGGTALASQTDTGGSWSATNAFNGSSALNNGWYSGDGNGGTSSSYRSDIVGSWLRYDFGSAVSVASVELAPLTGFTWSMPAQFAVDYSADGKVWKQVNIMVTAAGADGVVQAFTLAF